MGLNVQSAGMRAPVLSLIERCERWAMIDLYNCCHPDSETYLSLGDFHL